MDRFTTFKDGWCVLGDGAYMDDALSIRGDAIDRLAAYEDTGTEPEEIGDVVMHCKELGLGGLLGLLNAIATDRLIVLPCTVGDTVWKIVRHRVDVSGYRMEWEWETCVEAVNFSIGMFEAIGKTVFLTRAEAEAALVENGKSET